MKGYLRAGKIYLQSGRFKEAENQYREALFIDPKNETALQEVMLFINKLDFRLISEF